MANTDAPFGLRPVRHVSGAPYNGAANKYYIPSTDSAAAVYVGGLVKLTGAADANGIPVVTGNVASANAVIGVVVAVIPDTADSLMYRANSTSRYVLVADDPNLLFEVQADDVSATLDGGAIGATINLTGFTSGSTVTGRSAIEIDSDSISETSDPDDDVYILGFVQSPGNVLGDTNGRWLVRLNNHALVDAAVGV